MWASRRTQGCARGWAFVHGSVYVYMPVQLYMRVRAHACLFVCVSRHKYVCYTPFHTTRVYACIRMRDPVFARSILTRVYFCLSPPNLPLAFHLCARARALACVGCVCLVGVSGTRQYNRCRGIVTASRRRLPRPDFAFYISTCRRQQRQQRQLWQQWQRPLACARGARVAANGW